MSIRHSRPLQIIIVGLILVVVALIVGLLLRSNPPTTEIHLGNAVFHTGLVTTDAGRRQGLSGVESLKSDSGLLMVFPSDSEWGIWMKDMKIPLDIVWLNNEKKVIYIEPDLSPSLGTSRVFTPTSPAHYVIELPAGTVKTASIQVGDVATFTAREGQ